MRSCMWSGSWVGDRWAGYPSFPSTKQDTHLHKFGAHGVACIRERGVVIVGYKVDFSTIGHHPPRQGLVMGIRWRHGPAVWERIRDQGGHDGWEAISAADIQHVDARKAQPRPEPAPAPPPAFSLQPHGQIGMAFLTDQVPKVHIHISPWRQVDGLVPPPNKGAEV